MRYKLIISYDGTTFHGFQRQSKLVSIQGTIEEALKLIFKEEVLIKGAGRTDAKVHALNQYAHFDSNIYIPPQSLKKVLNKRVSPYIYIKDIEITDESFHARLSAKKKEYRYIVSLNEYDPLKANYCYFYPYQLDIEKIKLAMPYIVGTHDFTSFSKKLEDNMVRTIESFELKVDNNILTFSIIGDGFLHNMVRIIIALMLKVGSGKIEPTEIENIINQRNRSLVPYTAPAQGLYLYNIWY
jgi:tRNA pseudouridine38-40 synthase